MAKHALLGPSSSKMWLNCVGSARLNEKFPDKGSEYTEEGSFAHSLAEHFLRYRSGELSVKSFNAGYEDFKKGKWFTQEMADHCNAYAEYVMAQEGEAIFIEQQLDYSNWVPEGFGTGDAIRANDEVLNVIDLKYGKGVAVEAEDNTQLKFYGLGAIVALRPLFDFTKVRVHIFQPRLGDPVSAEYTVQEILDWADSIRDTAQKAWDGVREYKAGEWCKFCKAKATCRTRVETEAARAFDDMNILPEDVKEMDPRILADWEIAYWLRVADPVIKFFNDLKKHTLQQALTGVKWPGFKLVEGRSNRKYAAPTAIMGALQEAGVRGYMKEPELLGVTELEKLLGKKRFEELVEPHIVKAQGKPTLVPESDKRPELNSDSAAALAFSDDEGGEE